MRRSWPMRRIPGLNTIWVTQGGFAPARARLLLLERAALQGDPRGVRGAHRQGAAALRDARMPRGRQAADGLRDAASPRHRGRPCSCATSRSSTTRSSVEAADSADARPRLVDAGSPAMGVDRCEADRRSRSPIISRPSARPLRSVPLATWKDHLRLRAIENYSPYLSTAFVQERLRLLRTHALGHAAAASRAGSARWPNWRTRPATCSARNT